MTSKRFFVLLFILFITKNLFSSDEDYYINMNSQYIHLANSFPQLLYFNLQYAKNHRYSDDEILIIKEKELEILKIKYSKELSLLKEEYDKNIFLNDFNTSEHMLINEEIYKKKLDIEGLDITSIQTPEPILPIKFLLDKGSLNNDELSKILTSDIIIKGSMEMVDEWIYVEIWVENKILDTENLIFKSIASSDTLDEVVKETSNKLKTIILGRAWASLKLNIDPESSKILVQDNENQFSEEDFEYIYPGKYSVTISSPGYKPEQFEINLKELEHLDIDLKLTLEESGLVSIQSFPQGADLYSGALWLGTTPLIINKPLIPALLTIKLDGYNDSKYIFSNSEIRDIKIFMKSSLIDKNYIITTKRNNFYKSFSTFLLSIPLSMLSFGMSSDYGYAYNNEVLIYPGSSETDRLMELSTTWYNIYIGSLFINISLFVNTIFDLVDYIQSNNSL